MFYYHFINLYFLFETVDKSIGIGVIAEIYGKTKGTAAVYEAIQYAKPLVIPNDFNIITELESSTLKYTDVKDLENKLTKLILNKQKIEKLKEEANNNSKKFSIQVLQKYFIEEILEKLDEL